MPLHENTFPSITIQLLVTATINWSYIYQLITTFNIHKTPYTRIYKSLTIISSIKIKLKHHKYRTNTCLTRPVHCATWLWRNYTKTGHITYSMCKIWHFVKFLFFVWKGPLCQVIQMYVHASAIYSNNQELNKRNASSHLFAHLS